MTGFGTYPSLSEKRAFVTGGATGIGAAIVRAYAAQGVCVGFLDKNDGAGSALAEELAHDGTPVWFRTVNVEDVDALQRAISNFAESCGHVDCLVNNVANDTRHEWRSVTQESWNNAFAVNLTPAFFAIQSVAGAMLDRQGGSIINFGSISWKAKHGGMPAYTTAKAAVHGLTRSFVSELGSKGVRINTIVPGWVLTERQMADHYGDDGVAVLATHQALSGVIREADVAALVMFLSSDDSAMCTGQEFTIDGGWI